MARSLSPQLGNIIWSALTIVFLIWTVLLGASSVGRVVRERDLLGVAGLVVFGVVGFWLVAGAWLRTTWGQRFLARRRGGFR